MLNPVKSQFPLKMGIVARSPQSKQVFSSVPESMWQTVPKVHTVVCDHPSGTSTQGGSSVELKSTGSRQSKSPPEEMQTLVPCCLVCATEERAWCPWHSGVWPVGRSRPGLGVSAASSVLPRNARKLTTQTSTESTAHEWCFCVHYGCGSVSSN